MIGYWPAYLLALWIELMFLMGLDKHQLHSYLAFCCSVKRRYQQASGALAGIRSPDNLTGIFIDGLRKAFWYSAAGSGEKSFSHKTNQSSRADNVQPELNTSFMSLRDFSLPRSRQNMLAFKTGKGWTIKGFLASFRKGTACSCWMDYLGFRGCAEKVIHSH